MGKFGQLGSVMTIPQLTGGFTVGETHQLPGHAGGARLHDFVGLSEKKENT